MKIFRSFRVNFKYLKYKIFLKYSVTREYTFYVEFILCHSHTALLSTVRFILSRYQFRLKSPSKMLQNDAVRTLQYDSEIRVAQQPNPSEPRGKPMLFNFE